VVLKRRGKKETEEGMSLDLSTVWRRMAIVIICNATKHLLISDELASSLHPDIWV
jgi:hypothetical protein